MGETDKKKGVSSGVSAKCSEKYVEKSGGKHRGKLALGIILMMLWVAVSVIGSQVVVGWLMIAVMGAETFSQPVPTAVYSALSYCLAMILVIAVPTRLSAKWKVSRQDLGLHGWPTWTDIGLAPVGYIVYVILAAGIVWVFSLFPWFDAAEVQDIGFSYYVSGLDRVVAFLTLVVVAPIAEEIIFRGWLYGKMREKLNVAYSNVVSMIISSLLVSVLFGLVHMQWNVGVNVFALSLILCGLREITGTIYAGMLLHMVKNGVAFVLLYVVGVG